MRLSDLLRCAKPLLFDDGFEGFEYTGGGTFFLARFKKRYFGVTAKHCFYKRDKQKVKLMYDENGPVEDFFLPVISIHIIPDPPSGFEDWTDLALMEIDVSRLSEEQLQSKWFLDIADLIRRNVVLKMDDLLVTRGFPNELGGIDYDKRKIVTKGFQVDGAYAGKTSDLHMHIFRFSDLSQIEDTNGISGSPVFLMRKHFAGFDYFFAGMNVKGSKESGISRFIHCSVVFNAFLHV